jgi:hypothetical protein
MDNLKRVSRGNFRWNERKFFNEKLDEIDSKVNEIDELILIWHL